MNSSKRSAKIARTPFSDANTRGNFARATVVQTDQDNIDIRNQTQHGLDQLASIQYLQTATQPETWPYKEIQE
jgi:hypothetical protein